jgi:hypothetical protein
MENNVYRLEYAIPVMVTRADSRSSKDTCHIIELNPAGLLIESTAQFEEGENITVHLIRDLIPFKVISCLDSFNVGKFTCQLSKLDEDMNLDLYFSSFSKIAG